MSRQYLNDRWCVRCGKTSPTPFLKKSLKFIEDKKLGSVVDIGCGNGRNTLFLRQEGFQNVTPLDMKPDFGIPITLGKDAFPVKSADVILANYVLMFLSLKERKQIYREIKRIASHGCTFIYELYPAKDSYCLTKEDMLALGEEIIQHTGFTKLRKSIERGILVKSIQA